MDGYYAFMLVATALVLMMTVPALALFYGGMTRSKSVLNMMMMSFVSFGIASIVFVLWGWSEGWGADGAGNANGKLIGRHRSTGIGRPRFWDRARYFGEEKRLAAALDAAEAAGDGAG